MLFFHYFSKGEPCSPLLTDNNFYIKNGRENSVLHLQTIFSTVIFNFQLSISSFFTCVSAHTLVQEEKSDRNYKKDYRTDCKGDKNIVHTLNKKVVERP